MQSFASQGHARSPISHLNRVARPGRLKHHRSPSVEPASVLSWACPDALLGVGVDRIDYTKGIEERLLAVEALLEAHPELVGRFVFVAAGEPQPNCDPRAIAP